MLAFAMCAHGRLAQHSPANTLNTNLVDMILRDTIWKEEQDICIILKHLAQPFFPSREHLLQAAGNKLDDIASALHTSQGRQITRQEFMMKTTTSTTRYANLADLAFNICSCFLDNEDEDDSIFLQIPFIPTSLSDAARPCDFDTYKHSILKKLQSRPQEAVVEMLLTKIGLAPAGFHSPYEKQRHLVSVFDFVVESFTSQEMTVGEQAMNSIYLPKMKEVWFNVCVQPYCEDQPRNKITYICELDVFGDEGLIRIRHVLWNQRHCRDCRCCS